MKNKKQTEYAEQCWGCEHRVKAHRAGHGPRCECTTFASATCGCYMYSPAPPLIERRGQAELKLHGRKRPLYAGMLGARKSARLAGDDEIRKITVSLNQPEEVIQFWLPTYKLLKRMRGNYQPLDELIDDIEREEKSNKTGAKHGKRKAENRVSRQTVPGLQRKERKGV